MPRFLETLARLMPRRPMALVEEKASRTGPLIALETLGRPVWTPRDYAAFAREGFMQNAIVYRAVRMISEAAASIPLLLYEGDTEIEEHALLDLVRRPNRDQTGTDFLESWYGYLLVSGNAYVEAVAIGGRIRELHALRPDRMKIVPGADGWPEAYEYTAGGQTVRFAGEAVPGVRPILHVKLFHPAHDHYGLSPIEAAATAIDIHNAAACWNKALLDNSARPSGALVYSGGSGRMTAEQFERLKAELETTYQGAKHAGRPLLLEGGLDWKALSLSPKDMDFIEAKRAAAREIALALGVPPMLLGIPGDNTYANYQEAQRAFWRSTVLPLVNRTAKALSIWLNPAFEPTGAPGGRLPAGESLGAIEIRPDLDQVEGLSGEREALWARLNATSFLTINEKRAAAGYGPVEEAPGAPIAEQPDDGIGAEPQRLVLAPSAAHDMSPEVLSLPFAKYRPDQPRAPRGTPDGGQWVDEGLGGGGSVGGNDPRVLSDAIPDDVFPPGARVAQNDPIEKYRVKLDEEEARGGHTIVDHVGKSDDELLRTLEQEVIHIPSHSFYKEAQGSFLSKESANDFVNRLLERSVSRVDAVASGALEEAWLEDRFGYPTGKQAFRSGPEEPLYIRPTYKVGVLIRHDRRSKRGYSVHTAYPLNDTNAGGGYRIER